jgi:hypothetical protein
LGDGNLPWHLPLLARGCRIAGQGALVWIPYGRTSKVHDAVWKGGEETFATLKIHLTLSAFFQRSTK